MRKRCNDPNTIGWRYYGGRGIRVCDRWNGSFVLFIEDMGECPDGMTIDRINNDGDYEPSNCRWASTVEQARNKSNTKLTEELVRQIKEKIRTGESTVSGMAIETGISYHTIYQAVNGRSWNGVT
jgi:hypothetical protein